ncbi:MAG: hypothetical protein P8X63_11680 [Desulfuromonadaceae bacterium]
MLFSFNKLFLFSLPGLLIAIWPTNLLAGGASGDSVMAPAKTRPGQLVSGLQNPAGGDYSLADSTARKKAGAPAKTVLGRGVLAGFFLYMAVNCLPGGSGRNNSLQPTTLFN